MTGYIRKFIGYTLLVLILISAISCDAPNMEEELLSPEERGIGDVTVSISYDKKLTPGIDNRIKYWEFMATPLFTLAPDEGEIYGRVDYWRELSAITTKPDMNHPYTSASLGRYMGGHWKFELRALNQNRHVIAIGETSTYISDGLENLVNISLYPDSADGTHGESADRTSAVTGATDKGPGSATTVRYGHFKIGFIINQLETNLDDMKINTVLQKKHKITGSFTDCAPPNITWTRIEAGQPLSDWYKAQTNSPDALVPAGKVYYEGSYELDAGLYMLSVNAQIRNKKDQWVHLAGQAFNIVIIGGEETSVTGYLTAGTYIVSGVQIAVPGIILGSINGKGSEVSVSNTALTLKWHQTAVEKENSQEVPAGFEWYIDGKKHVCTEDTLTITCPEKNGKPVYGVHRISIRPLGSAGSRGHADIDAIFNPTPQGNLGDHDWEETRTYPETIASIFDIDPGITGSEVVIGYKLGTGSPVRWAPGTAMIEYPYDTRVKTPKNIYPTEDVGVVPVYVDSAVLLTSSQAPRAWVGPSATLGQAGTAGSTYLRYVRTVPNAAKVQANAFRNFPNLEEISITSNVKEIGDYAFADCPALTEVSLNTIKIGAHAFENCTGLLYLDIATGSNIDTAVAAFKGCTALVRAELPITGSTVVPSEMFRNTTALASLTIPDSITEIRSHAFAGAGLTLLDTRATIIGDNAFLDNKAIEITDLPEVQTIGTNAFKGCTALASISIPKLRAIGSGSYQGCTALGMFDIPATVSDIPQNAFNGCTNISNVNFHSGLKTIGNAAFKGCTSLKGALLPGSVVSLGTEAFSNCTAMNHVWIPSTMVTIEANAFTGCDKITEVDFKTSTGWSIAGTGVDSSILSDKKTAAAHLIQNASSKWTH